MYRRGLSYLVLVLVFVTPFHAVAAVRIHEIAWMGNSANANAEWIELYNDSSEHVTLSGWTLASAGTAPNITLSGTIPAGGFFLLERTNDGSTEAVADQIYTGALSNSGDTLTLKDAAGVTIDHVVGGTNWQSIGGDNVTKKTAQRTDTGWITATPTPKAMNASAAEGGETATTTPETEESATTTPTATVGGSSAPTIKPKSPARVLFVDPGVARIVLEDVTTPYRAVAYTDKGIVKDARITWSFGDGTRELGNSVRHQYHASGEYLVVVRAEYEDAHALETLRVLVLKAAVSLTPHEEGVAITNTATTLLDLSDWKLTNGTTTFAFPDDTALSPQSSVVFPSIVTGLGTSTAYTLQFPSGKVAAVSTPVQPLPLSLGIEAIQEVVRPLPVAAQPYEEGIEAPAAPPSVVAAGAAYAPQPAARPSWLMCLFGSLLACGASFVVR
ncbi:MAG TPA: lamin tail domain-containing protein [Candidatus Paceibacterota bacterium]|nr:lamin tail domain-containing protein [Candidatus Paceibacterota bacterium]